LMCYSGLSHSNGTNIYTSSIPCNSPDLNDPHVCFAYKFLCTADDGSCNYAYAVGTQLISFGCMASSTATTIQSPAYRDIYIDAYSCSTDNCNYNSNSEFPYSATSSLPTTSSSPITSTAGI
jgi:hypothetical protein